MLIKIMSRWFGGFEDKYSIWDDVPIIWGSFLLSVFYWTPFAILTFGSPSNHILVIPTIIAMVVGFILSAFNDIKGREHRVYALGLHTILLPGFLLIIVLFGVGASVGGFIRALLKLQDGLLFIQDMLNGGLSKKLEARREIKRVEQDAKLKAIADKVRVSGEGYRMPFPACGECGQVLPESEIENDRSQIRHASG